MNPGVKKEKGDGSTPSNEWPVDDLLRRCACRPPDDLAWGEFVRRFNPIIRANVQREFHRRARDESDRKPQFPADVVEDLVQSVYCRLVEEHCRALKRFEGSHAHSIFKYLATISVNVVIDYFRAIKAEKRPKITYSIEELVENTGDGFLRNGETERMKHKGVVTADDIERALRKSVGWRHRERDMLIFKLHYLDGLTSEEIINTMGLDITPVAVNSILSRILKKMRSVMSSSR